MLRRSYPVVMVVVGIMLAAACVPARPPVGAATVPVPSTTVASGAVGSCALGAPSDGGIHFELSVDRGCPLRWDSCRPLPWWYNPAGERRTVAEVATAVDAVVASTGLRFEYQGLTAETPATWVTGSPWSRRGLVVGWEALDGPIGLARFVWTGAPAQLALASVALDPTWDETNPLAWRDLFLHELGHAVGLGHASDEAQVMYSVLNPPFTGAFRGGDLAGLRLVGAAQGCFPMAAHATTSALPTGVGEAPG